MAEQCRQIARRVRMGLIKIASGNTSKDTTPPSRVLPTLIARWRDILTIRSNAVDPFKTPELVTSSSPGSSPDTLDLPTPPDQTPIKTHTAYVPFRLESKQEDVITITEDGMYRSITGADLSLPVFDGTSKKSSDHLIDLDTDSMETALDVRCYFWMLGDTFHPEDPLNHTLEEAIAWDNQMVREGRLRLKEARDAGQG